jgi:hypothetical protein
MFSRLAEKILGAVPVNGFEFSEGAVGTHRFVERRRDRGEMPFSFSFKASSDEFKWFLHPDSRDFVSMNIEGVLNMDGLAAKAAFKGTIEASLFRRRQIIYDFTFKSSGGTDYRFHGHKDLSIFQPLKSITTLYGEVMNSRSGKIISTTVTYMDLRDIPRILASIRLR